MNDANVFGIKWKNYTQTTDFLIFSFRFVCKTQSKKISTPYELKDQTTRLELLLEQFQPIGAQ
jgi:hypothetical protein